MRASVFINTKALRKIILKKILLKTKLEKYLQINIVVSIVSICIEISQLKLILLHTD